jgi:putative DNA methylase
VKWENTNNEEVLNKAREEILKSTGGNLPPFYDPFCGGGSIPLEAQRLGLDSYASDLNPVAVLITKALIEIPPKFANMPPVNSVARSKLDFKNGWKGASGLAEDVRYYGKWMRDEAFKRIGHLYPKVKLPKEYGSREATVIAWIWCRTANSPTTENRHSALRHGSKKGCLCCTFSKVLFPAIRTGYVILMVK